MEKKGEGIRVRHTRSTSKAMINRHGLFLGCDASSSSSDS
jgi:hypothetical protein